MKILLLGALWCLAPTQVKAADGCPDLQGKGTAAHLEYLRGDRSTLTAKCIVAAIKHLGIKPYAQQASAVLIQYLDYQDPAYQHQEGVKGSIVLYAYPAVDVLRSLGKRVAPELTAVVASPDVTGLVRQNAAWAIFLMYGANQPEAVSVLVGAAHAQIHPIASIRLMDQARWLASRCIPAYRNDCENEVLK